ncbi:MAG: hypothetical protein UT28_C0001G0347 [Berkelbacteria bacterium GW2011_GWE1_39_12]|uniref:Uncharacterized protein n=1 Tax=Berkelbacteria bacterium GW2011_GWE1_39_12 TaxID=1618337 RepID=A0A0G4B2G7_9BACT|nr:MAG: hypothetical protein UT28_C0001G0347 [Berkelbacteria bacterium GW2011_GWE1_39_12]
MIATQPEKTLAFLECVEGDENTNSGPGIYCGLDEETYDEIKKLALSNCGLIPSRNLFIAVIDDCAFGFLIDIRADGKVIMINDTFELPPESFDEVMKRGYFKTIYLGQEARIHGDNIDLQSSMCFEIDGMMSDKDDYFLAITAANNYLTEFGV